MKTSSKLFAFLAIATVLITIGTRQSNHASAGPVGIVLHQDLLPPDAQVTLDKRIDDDNEPSHPLYREPVTGRAETGSAAAEKSVALKGPQHNYLTAHVKQVFVPSSKSMLINFAYEYADPAQAQLAAQALRKDIRGRPRVRVVNLKGGRAYQFKGDEGDDVFWFIGTTGNSLSLVLVNGLGADNVSALFDITVRDTLDKLADPVSETE